MQMFTDNEGAEWRIVIDAVVARQVEQDTGFQVLKLYLPTEMERLADNPLLMRDVVAALCGEEIRRREMTADDFLRRLRGDALEEAMLALYREVADFMPPKKKALLLEVVEKSQQSLEQDRQAANEDLQLLMELKQEERIQRSAKLRKKLDRLRQTISCEPSGTSSGTTAVSSESSPAE